MSSIHIRKFKETDISNKVRWINDEKNNQYLHYELPLEVEKTREWFYNIQSSDTRYDAVIECGGIPVGIIGLLNIADKKAEYYITLGEEQYKGKGIAKKASQLLFETAKEKLGLSLLYLYTEVDNVTAQRLFERLGFVKQGIENNSAVNRGKSVDRIYYTKSLQ